MFRNKTTKFIRFERVGDSWPEHARGTRDDMPLKDWRRIERSRDRVKRFKKIEEIDINNMEVKKVEPAIQEDPFECPLCGYIGKNEKALSMHKMKKH